MTQEPHKPLLIVIAGGNGAGKSTFYHLRIKPLAIPFINADDIAREYWPENPEAHSYDAMALANSSRLDAVRRRESHCFETVFSHSSKLDYLQFARSSGFAIHLYIIHVSDPAINVGRVRQRVHCGGHFVPEQKIRERIPRTIGHLKQALQLADESVLIDNSYVDDPFRVQARFDGRQWHILRPELENWVDSFTST